MCCYSALHDGHTGMKRTSTRCNTTAVIFRVFTDFLYHIGGMLLTTAELLCVYSVTVVAQVNSCARTILGFSSQLNIHVDKC
jgi:hypothetical protein